MEPQLRSYQIEIFMVKVLRIEKKYYDRVAAFTLRGEWIQHPTTTTKSPDTGTGGSAAVPTATRSSG